MAGIVNMYMCGPLLKLHLTALQQSVCGASEIWPNKRGGLRWEDPLKMNTTVNTGNHGHQENCWAPRQKEAWPPFSNSPNNDIQTKSTTD